MSFDLDPYARAAYSIAEELLDSISDPEVELLREKYRGRNCLEWSIWQGSHRAEVLAYACATSTGRQHEKWRFLLPDLKWAAYEEVNHTAIFLEAASRLAPGIPLGAAIEVHREFWRSLSADGHWPFDDDDPFAPD